MGKGDVFVISAPSGSGKTTICRMLLERLENVELSISYTTRPRKRGETDGKDYYFIKPEKFDTMVNLREFLEFASVYGNRYGTSRELGWTPSFRPTGGLSKRDWSGEEGTAPRR